MTTLMAPGHRAGASNPYAPLPGGQISCAIQAADSDSPTWAASGQVRYRANRPIRDRLERVKRWY